jgi:hypothetical protein
MDAYLVSHNGLGDNLIMISAVHFLSQFYNNVYFLCKKRYYPNVSLFFKNTPAIICVVYDENYQINVANDEMNAIQNIIQKIYHNDNTDVFVCGDFHKKYMQSKINNKLFLDYEIPDKNDTIDYNTITSRNYGFIETFYKDARLNLTVYYDFFHLPSLQESIDLYETVKKYKLVFLQLKSSCGTCLNITNLLNTYMHDDSTLLVCNDVNLYDENSPSDIIRKKHQLCQPFVLNKIVYYVDVIKNSDEIYAIDSCFIAILLPFIKNKLLKTDKVRIIPRNRVHQTMI